MILDELAKLIRAMAKQMKIPIVKIGVVEGDRSMDFRTVKRPRRHDPVEPHVACEIQTDGGLRLGKMSIKLSEVAASGDENKALIKRRLTAAAVEAGIEGHGVPSSAVG